MIMGNYPPPIPERLPRRRVNITQSVSFHLYSYPSNSILECAIQEETRNLIVYLPTIAGPYLGVNIHRNGSDQAKT